MRDAPALADSIDAAYSIYLPYIHDLPPVSEGIAEEIKNNLVWVALLDKQIVGGIVLVLENDCLVLENVAVRPDATGLGLGRTFMNLAETEARRLGAGKLRLSTHVKMPENVRLYKHLGWRETGRSGNKVHMEKSLAL